MIVEFYLLGGLLLAWAFGRNNFSNVFGSAVGTGILSLKFSAFLTGTFMLFGALLNGSGTSDTLNSLTHFSSLSDACVFSVIIALMMLILTRWGIPASVAQICVGALVGWDLASHESVAWDKVISIVWGWFYSPFIACFLSFVFFKTVRLYLKYVPVPILYRDMGVRILWVIVGSFTAYSLGANNMPVLTVPFNSFITAPYLLPVAFSLIAGIGCVMASMKVIKTVSSKLFPLSSVESLIVGFSASLTLLLFSFKNGLLPALPISMGAALIGSIVGVSLGKGGYGLKGKTLFNVVLSWFLAPLFSGLLCFIFQTIITVGRF